MDFLVTTSSTEDVQFEETTMDLNSTQLNVDNVDEQLTTESNPILDVFRNYSQEVSEIYYS